jgi:hypothetical protein
MKTNKSILFFIICFLFLVTGCETTNTPIILPEGPITAEMVAEKNAQIKRLSDQIIDIEKQRAEEKLLAAKAASSVKAMVKANEYQPEGRPTEAINEEAKVALKRLPADDPAETVEALKRTIEMIEGKRDEALKMYATARDEAEKKKVEIAEKDKEIKERNKQISERNLWIAELERLSAEEKDKHKKDVETFIKEKNDEIQKIKDEQASKERRWWINATRIVGLGFIVVGGLVMFILKSPGTGGGFLGLGVFIGLLSIFIDWVTAQWWFPWLCGLIIIGILIACGLAIYRMWKIKKLDEMKTAAIQDFKDESLIKDKNAWESFSEHLKYRIGDKNSSWGKAQMKETAALGLINPKAEPANKEIEKEP